MARARRPGRPLPAAPAGDERTVELTRRLASLLAELNLAEVEVECTDVRVRVQRTVTAPPAPGALTAPAAAPGAEPSLAAEPGGPALVTVEAPMVGTFYRASSPTAAPYVQEGDAVKEGQVLCIIEAMKLMNEIETKVAGRVARILVENGQAVEYGQPLFLLDPRV
jgi:acetyl-CoA carboxylase biotin carboxyl carrier protein